MGVHPCERGDTNGAACACSSADAAVAPTLARAAALAFAPLAPALKTTKSCNRATSNNGCTQATHCGTGEHLPRSTNWLRPWSAQDKKPWPPTEEGMAERVGTKLKVAGELKEEFERGYFGDLREELRRMPRKGATPVSPAAGQQPASAGTAPPAQVTPLLPVSRSSSSSSSSLGRCAHVR